MDFLRLGEGAIIRVNIPVHVRGAEISPGVKRGGAVNIVEHTIAVRVRADQIPEEIVVDVSDLDINHSRHLNEITLPPGVQVMEAPDATLVTIVPPSGYAEEMKARPKPLPLQRRRCCCRRRRAACSDRRTGCRTRGSGCRCCCSRRGYQSSAREEVRRRTGRPEFDPRQLKHPFALPS